MFRNQFANITWQPRRFQSYFPEHPVSKHKKVNTNFCQEHKVFGLKIKRVVVGMYTIYKYLIHIQGVHLILCFFLKMLWFFWTFVSSAAALVFYLLGVCTHTGTKGKQRKTRVRNILKSLEKTQYLMNTLYYNAHVFNAYIHKTRNFNN